ncbi:translocation/assembly module TamB domain-containing protein [Ectothiorhodospira variabilis]|uniref:translocation/assembly module TamB domain-containing protein n=1 Tax=Ectothiorhodospira variabilis TaxID=505694 RepID=UPI001EFB8952|nr:translocation/assembly module TamB domain-containing protein [Ectothiorhodospira variabilis]
MIRRALISLVVVLLLLVALITGLVTALVATEPGARLVVKQGVGFVPGELRIEQVSGTLLTGLRAEGVVYTHEALNASLESLDLQMELLPLTGLAVHINALDAQGLELTLTPDPDAPPPDPDAPFTLPDAIPMPVTVDLTQGVIQNIRFRTQEQAEPILVDEVRLSLHLDAERALIRDLNVQTPDIQARASGRAALAQPYPLALSLDWQLDLPEAARELLPDEPARGRLALEGDLDSLTIHHRLLGPLSLVSAGRINQPITDLNLDLTHQWEPFELDLAPEQHLSVASGTLTTRGGLEAYELGLSAALQVTDLPAANLALAADGNLESLNLAPLSVTSPAGNLEVAGRLGWVDAPDWALQVRGRDLNPAEFVADLTGRLNLDLHTRGRLDPEQGVVAQVDLQRLAGQLRDYPVTGQGQVAIEGTTLNTPGLRLGVGENRLSTRGRVSDTLALDFDLNAPDLPALWPGLEGRVNASGQVSGPLEAPVVSTRADIRDLGLGDLSLARLDLDLEAGVSPDSPLRLDLEARDLRLGQDLELSSLSLQGSGTAQAHEINLDLEADQGQLGLTLEGALDEGPAWAGQLTRLDLDQPQAGAWQLQTAVGLHASPHAAGLEDSLCLAQNEGRLCLDGHWSAEAGAAADLQLTELSLQILTPFLPPNLRIDGSLGATASLRLDDQLWLEARVEPSAGELRLRDLDDEEHIIPYQDGQVDLLVEDRDITARLALGFLEGGQVDGRLDARQRDDGDLDLDGDVQVALDEFRWLMPLVPQVTDPGGRLRVDLTVGGTTADPRIEGLLTLTEGTAFITEAGITVEALNLELRNEGLERLVFAGDMRSGPGALEVDGEVQLADGDMPIIINVRGDRFQAARRPDVQALVSPDLRITLIGQRAIVTGQVEIPEARVELVELPPQAVSVSRDELILDDEEEAGEALVVIARVRVILGDDVRISGYGLEARLTGDIAVQDSPGRPTRLVGEVRVAEGRYKAYGQDLTVERGIIVFQGPPENPGLNIRASRSVPAYDVVVGLEIGGTLEEPRSRVFSEPPMEDSDALAFLVTGRPLSGAGEGEATDIVSAVAMFGIERGGFITDRIGQEVGLDEFTVDTGTELEDSALMMGKYLSPRLFLRYSVGLFDRVNTVMLRYQLTRTLSLETRSSSEAQSMDLLYRRER